jgi:hypothetical protein
VPVCAQVPQMVPLDLMTTTKLYGDGHARITPGKIRLVWRSLLVGAKLARSGRLNSLGAEFLTKASLIIDHTWLLQECS